MANTAKTKSEKATLAARRTGCYIALVLISFLCLFFFYVLIVNSTRTHFEIQKGFSLLPGKSLMTNLKNVLNDANIPVLTGVRNSLIVSACSAALSVYFSALTAYGIYAYNFRFKKAAFAIILLIMTMPTQVSALGFLQLITKMGLKNSFLPLIIPSIAAPAVFFFMKQYLDASLPMEIVEAARIDGAGEFYTFNKIVLPHHEAGAGRSSHLRLRVQLEQLLHPRSGSGLRRQKDPAHPDRTAAQRGLPEVRYGQSLHDGRHRHPARHHRLPAALEVHRPRRGAGWRERLKFRPRPVAETGRNFWRSGLQDARPAQGPKRMQGTARGRCFRFPTGKPNEHFLRNHPFSFHISSKQPGWPPGCLLFLIYKPEPLYYNEVKNHRRNPNLVHLIEVVYRFLWGDWFVLPIAGGVGISLMVVLLLTAGVFFTLRTRLLPVRLFRDMISAVCEKNQNRESLSSFQTLVVSTATRVGMGNLVGVVAAVSAGGAGAVFWMWVTALLGPPPPL